MGFSASWKDIMDEVDDFSKLNSGLVWFRGHSNSTYSLDSGLFRLKIGTQIKEYIELELQMFHYFKSLGYLQDLEERNDWTIVYSMQHHGLRTRLLDWSESFVVALFFATLGWNKGDCCIWMVNPEKLNQESIGVSQIKLPIKNDFIKKHSELNLKSRAIFPNKSNQRIVAQHGVFTVQGNSLKPLESEFGDILYKNGGLKKINLPMEIREDVYHFLRLNGINHFSLFPDLDGLSRHINDIHIKPSWI
ncbi:FRG domain-containing protein [Peribacillus frigoritolerans]|uniref:FRG domain-containing protein n=1 Tax=Peribacillus frigoritolerans TaxID=450367 RepID=UPI0021618099|nr:FRG domain-containing protein [Peribacillus frigoritolerans]